MKHSIKISLAVFAAVFATLTLSAYKKETAVTAKPAAPCSKICSLQKDKTSNSTGAYYGAFLPLDNIISEN